MTRTCPSAHLQSTRGVPHHLARCAPSCGPRFYARSAAARRPAPPRPSEPCTCRPAPRAWPRASAPPCAPPPRGTRTPAPARRRAMRAAGLRRPAVTCTTRRCDAGRGFGSGDGSGDGPVDGSRTRPTSQRRFSCEVDAMRCGRRRREEGRHGARREAVRRAGMAGTVARARLERSALRAPQPQVRPVDALARLEAPLLQLQRRTHLLPHGRRRRRSQHHQRQLAHAVGGLEVA